MKPSPAKEKPAKRGLKAERLKLGVIWREAIRPSFLVKQPAKGWPKVEA